MERKIRLVIVDALDRLPIVVCRIYLGNAEIGEIKLRHTYKKAKNFLELLKDGFQLEDRVEQEVEDDITE